MSKYKFWKRSRRAAIKGVRVSPPTKLEEGFVRRISRYLIRRWDKLFAKKLESPYAKRKKRIKTKSRYRFTMSYYKKPFISILVLLITSSNLLASARAVEHDHDNGIYGSAPLLGLNDETEDFDLDSDMEGGGCCSYEQRSYEDGTGSVFPIFESEYDAGGDPLLGTNGERMEDIGYPEFENYEGSATETAPTPTVIEKDVPMPKEHLGSGQMKMMEMKYAYQEGPLTPADAAHFKSVLVSLVEEINYAKASRKSGSGQEDQSPEERAARFQYQVLSYYDSAEQYQEAVVKIGQVLDATVALNAAIAAEVAQEKKQTAEFENILDNMIKNNAQMSQSAQMFDDLQTDSEEPIEENYTSEELNRSEGSNLVEPKSSEQVKSTTVPTPRNNSATTDQLEDPIPLVAPALAVEAEA